MEFWHGDLTKHTLYIMWSTPIVKASVDWYNESATPHGTILLYRYRIMDRFGPTINEQWGMRTYLPSNGEDKLIMDTIVPIIAVCAKWLWFQ